MKIITKKEAVALGVTRYFTGVPCKQGHISERKVKGSACIRCRLNRTRSRNRNRWENDPVYRAKESARNKRRNPSRKLVGGAEGYDKLLAQQGEVCAICRKPCRTGRELAVDHCHGTGKGRGLLCFHCNTGIGKLNDDPELLKRAVVYLALPPTMFVDLPERLSKLSGIPPDSNGKINLMKPGET